MAATKTTNNKIRNLRNLVFWIAQQPNVLSGNCPECKKPLIPKGATTTAVYDLTMEHLSKSYDHKKRKEKQKAKGGVLMHKSCHKIMEAKYSGLGTYKRSLI